MLRTLLAAAIPLFAGSDDWPSFRGRMADGLGNGTAATSWNADPSAGPERGVKWKTPIPGLGHSSPIVWGNHVFVATAVSAAGEAPLRVGLYGDGDSAKDGGEQRWNIYAVDKNTGRIVWERTAYKGLPRSQRHTKATHANTTLATDGKRLVAFFGSEGLYAYSLTGDLLWKKDLGKMVNGPAGWNLEWGYASSPTLANDTILIQCDAMGGPFVAALSAKDGRELWRTSRAGVSTQSWGTPAVIGNQVVLNGYPYIASYDFATGKELWRLKSEGDIPVPTPIFAHGLIYVTNAHGGGQPLYAIRPDASGDITPATGTRTSTGVVWSEARNGAYMQTPLVLGDLIYSCSDRGILKVYDARTGKRHYEQRLGKGTTGFSSSPVAVGGNLYFASEEGEIYVVKSGPTFELLATNTMGEITMATPAVSEGVFFYRTRGHLVAIAGAAEQAWDRFRGPNGSGVSETSGLPAEFGPARNVIWKTDVPVGLSSPVLTKDRIFLTALEDDKLSTICLNRETGRVIWKSAQERTRKEKLHKLNHASAASVATDGRYAVAFFTDYGMVAYDVDGGTRWRLPMGPFNNLYGMGASPVIASGKVILTVDQSKDSFIATYDLASGKQLWKTPRPEALSGHSTPIVHGNTVIAPGSFRMDAYDIATGKIAWSAEGLPSEMKSVPVIDGDTIYIHGFNTPDNDPGRILQIPAFAAVDKNADGRITKDEATDHAKGIFEYIDLVADGAMNAAEWDQYRRTMQAENAMLAFELGTGKLKWKFQRSIPQLPSPLVYRGVVYMVNEAGVATTLDAASGALHKQARLRGQSDRYYASPVAADGKVYVASHTGVVSVLRAGPGQELLAANDLGDEILATPAIAGGRLYVRTRSALYCFGNTQVARAQR